MDEIIRSLDDFRHRIKDYCENPNEPDVIQLERIVQDAFDHARSHLPLDKLEWKIKDIEEYINGLKQTEGIFKFQDIDDMHERTIKIRESLKEMIDKQ